MSSPEDGDDAGDPVNVGDAGLKGAYMSINTVAVTCAGLPLLQVELTLIPDIESTGRHSCELSLLCRTVINPEVFELCIENNEPQE